MSISLQSERVTPYEVLFTFTVIDFFGPIMVKNCRKIEKRWGVVFICRAAKAVSVGMAYSLSTASYIIVIRKFINRQGYNNFREWNKPKWH